MVQMSREDYDKAKAQNVEFKEPAPDHIPWPDMIKLHEEAIAYNEIWEIAKANSHPSVARPAKATMPPVAVRSVTMKSIRDRKASPRKMAEQQERYRQNAIQAAKMAAQAEKPQGQTPSSIGVMGPDGVVRIPGPNPGDLKEDGTIRKNRYRPRRPQAEIDKERAEGIKKRARSHRKAAPVKTEAQANAQVDAILKENAVKIEALEARLAEVLAKLQESKVIDNTGPLDEEYNMHRITKYGDPDVNGVRKVVFRSEVETTTNRFTEAGYQKPTHREITQDSPSI